MQLGQIAGGYYSSVDKLMEHAVVVQDDLKQDYYGGNVFDIGKFDELVYPITIGFLEESIIIPMILSSLIPPIYVENISVVPLGFNFKMKPS